MHWMNVDYLLSLLMVAVSPTHFRHESHDNNMVDHRELDVHSILLHAPKSEIVWNWIFLKLFFDKFANRNCLIDFCSMWNHHQFSSHSLPADQSFVIYRFPFVASVVAKALSMDSADTCSSAAAFQNRWMAAEYWIVFAAEVAALDFATAYSLAVEQQDLVAVAVVVAAAAAVDVLVLLNSNLDWVDQPSLIHLVLILRMHPNLLARLTQFYYHHSIEHSPTRNCRHLLDFHPYCQLYCLAVSFERAAILFVVATRKWNKNKRYLWAL